MERAEMISRGLVCLPARAHLFQSKTVVGRGVESFSQSDDFHDFDDVKMGVFCCMSM